MTSSYEMYGWKPCHTLTDHENFMDLLLLITRSSQLKQGSMACILVQPPTEIFETQQQQHQQQQQQACEDGDDNNNNNNNDDGIENASRKRTKLFTNKNLMDRIITIATNQSFYKENDSDIHAEIVAISQVANRSSTSSSVPECSHEIGSTIRTTTPTTHNAIAYITMPPCKRCFAALVTAGITQIVSRYQSADIIQTIANQRNIQMIVIPENRIRIQKIIDTYYHQQTKNEQSQQQKTTKEIEKNNNIVE